MLIEFSCTHVVKVKSGANKTYIASKGYKIEDDKLYVFAKDRSREFCFSGCWDSVQDCGILYESPGQVGWL